MSAIKYEEELKRVFIAHEKSTNVFLDHTNWLWVGLYSILFLLDLFFFKALDATIINMILLASYVLLFAAVHIWVKSKDFTGRWVKYVLMAPILLSSIGMTIFSEAMFDVAYVALLMISSAYYNRRVVLSISLLGIFSYALAKCLYLLIDFDNLATEYEESFSEDTLWVSFPFFLLYVIFSVFSVLKAMSGKKEIENYVREYCENISMNNELSVARSIQHGMLQPEAYITEDFEIYASMSSAKAVGGDFYDYYRKDERYVFFNIADVSGKGLPASMFAVNTNSFLRAYSTWDIPVDHVCNTTNKTLCERNPEKMFVTAFVGFLDITTGMVSYVNAGHTPAYVLRANGSVEQVCSKPNFVLGRKGRFSYKSEHIKLESGDRLFLYTDGITEAMSTDGTLFGNDRLKLALEEGVNNKGKALIDFILDKVNEFSAGAEQADDMTILMLDYKSNCKSYKTATQTFDVSKENYNSIIDFIKELPQSEGWSQKIINNACLCTDETFANLDMYAFPPTQTERKLTITTTIWDNYYKIVFADNGMPFNPLAVNSTNVTEGIKKQRKKGGLGIYMVKNLADFTSYKFDNKQNILTIELWK